MSNNLTPLGQEINKYLKSAGWTQQDLADHSGITRSAISKLMRGKTKPKPETIDALANALGLDPVLLMRLAGIPLPPKDEALHPAALYIAQQLTKLPSVPQEQTISAIQSMIDAIYTAYHIAPGASEEQMALHGST